MLFLRLLKIFLISTVAQMLPFSAAQAQPSSGSTVAIVPKVVQLPDTLTHVYEGSIGGDGKCSMRSLSKEKEWPYLKNSRAVFLRKFSCVTYSFEGYATLAEFFVAGRKYYVDLGTNDDLKGLLQDIPLSHEFTEYDAVAAAEISQFLSGQDFEELLRRYDSIKSGDVHLYVYGARRTGEYSSFSRSYFGVASSGSRTLKYVSLEYVGLNAVGDIVRDRVGGVVKHLRAVGPIKPGQASLFMDETAWLSPTVVGVRILKMTAEFMDGSKATFSHPKIPAITSEERSTLQALGIAPH